MCNNMVHIRSRKNDHTSLQTVRISTCPERIEIEFRNQTHEKLYLSQETVVYD